MILDYSFELDGECGCKDFCYIILFIITLGGCCGICWCCFEERETNKVKKERQEQENKKQI